MSGATFAILVGGLMALATYMGKRLVDYILPPDRHWTILDRWSRPNTKETPDDVEP